MTGKKSHIQLDHAKTGGKLFQSKTTDADTFCCGPSSVPSTSLAAADDIAAAEGW